MRSALAALSFPRAQVCAECLSQDIGATHLSEHGDLYAAATVYQAPKHWDVPYTLGYVDLPEGIRVLAHIEGEAAIGARVELGIGRVGTDPSGQILSSYVFRPAEGGEA